MKRFYGRWSGDGSDSSDGNGGFGVVGCCLYLDCTDFGTNLKWETGVDDDVVIIRYVLYFVVVGVQLVLSFVVPVGVTVCGCSRSMVVVGRGVFEIFDSGSKWVCVVGVVFDLFLLK